MMYYVPPLISVCCNPSHVVNPGWSSVRSLTMYLAVQGCTWIVPHIHTGVFLVNSFVTVSLSHFDAKYDNLV